MLLLSFVNKRFIATLQVGFRTDVCKRGTARVFEPEPWSLAGAGVVTLARLQLQFSFIIYANCMVPVPFISFLE